MDLYDIGEIARSRGSFVHGLITAAVYAVVCWAMNQLLDVPFWRVVAAAIAVSANSRLARRCYSVADAI